MLRKRLQRKVSLPSHLVQPAADEMQGLGAQDAMEEVDGVQDLGHARGDDVEVICHPAA